MCTVSYIPTNNGYVLTSNRDEHFSRPHAELPNKKQYQEEGIWYPKDGGAGGSWIALKQDGNSAVLLNGAFEKHIKEAKYRKSRGLIFLSIIKQDNLLHGFTTEKLDGIEPFTLIVKNAKGLFECNWDGKNKHLQEKDRSLAHIWSSCTLYNQEVRLKRGSYFSNWFINNSIPSVAQIVEMHQSSPFPNNAENFMMQRSDGISTVSITCIKVDSEQSEINYLDNSSAIPQKFSIALNHLEWQNNLSHV
jgi:Transport and Golgi organisation 2